MNINESIQFAIEYYKAGKLQQAENICKEIVKVQSDNVDALHFLGVICYQLGKYDSAIQYLERALTCNPTDAEAYYHLGHVFQDKKNLDEAIDNYQKALQLNPDLTGAYYYLGIAFKDKGHLDEAIANYQKALQLNPDLTGAYNNLGNIFQEKGQFEKAITCYQKAIELNPNFAWAYNNLGVSLQEKGQFDEALTCFKKTIELNPNFLEAQWNISLILLLSGNLQEGWKGFKWYSKIKGMSFQRNFPQPLWDGSDISGRTILLHADYGLGDTIQFIRYVQFVAQLGAKVIVECQKELTSLLQNIEGIYQVIAHGESLPEFDIHCPLLGLPLVFDTTLENIPAKIPYITVDPLLVNSWHDKMKADRYKIRIGLVWGGRHPKKKSCSLETFLPLDQFDDITFYSLQKGEASEQAKNPPKGMKLIDYTEDIKDFSDTAALIENLDLIISVDTAVAHLAGALGKPVWTLLPFLPDWRWMLNRKDSPWYPTMRLFRQPSPGDWKQVISCVKKELSEFIKFDA